MLNESVKILPLPRVINFKFLLQPHQKYYITYCSMENVVFHSLLRCKIITLPIVTTPLIHLYSKMLGECTFWAWEWKGHCMVLQSNLLETFAANLASLSWDDGHWIVWGGVNGKGRGGEGRGGEGRGGGGGRGGRGAQVPDHSDMVSFCSRKMRISASSSFPLRNPVTPKLKKYIL